MGDFHTFPGQWEPVKKEKRRNRGCASVAEHSSHQQEVLGVIPRLQNSPRVSETIESVWNNQVKHIIITKCQQSCSSEEGWEDQRSGHLLPKATQLARGKLWPELWTWVCLSSNCVLFPLEGALLLLWPENQLFRGWRKWAGSLCLSIQPDKSEQAGFWLTHTCVSLHIPEGPLSQAWVLEVKPQELLTVCDSGLPFSFAHSAVCTIGSSEQVPPGITVKGKPKNRLSTLHSQQY